VFSGVREVYSLNTYVSLAGVRPAGIQTLHWQVFQQVFDYFFDFGTFSEFLGLQMMYHEKGI